jgi:hypothetical protein
MDPEKNTYTNNLIQCAINLTDLKVATRNVGPVIKEVAKLDRKVTLAHKQVGKLAVSSISTILYTDETRKHGKTYQTYVISDNGSSYMLGLREMSDKSGSTALETLNRF